MALQVSYLELLLFQDLQSLVKSGAFEPTGTTIVKVSKSSNGKSAREIPSSPESTRGYTMQLVNASAGASSSERNGEGDEEGDGSSRLRALDHVASVLADAYGPFVFQQVT